MPSPANSEINVGLHTLHSARAGPRQGESVLPFARLAEDGTAESATLEVRKVSRHDQAPRGISELGYMEVKRALLERLSQGGRDTDLDVLQAAATGLVVRPGQEPCQHWVPLLAMMAEGPVHGVQADLIDPDLTKLSSIARFSWPYLIGRTVAQQLTMDKTTLVGNLVRFELPEVIEATSGDDWSDLDLGGAYRKARRSIRVKNAKHVVMGQPYASHEDVLDALIVAEAVLSLRGFPGSGQHTLPYALSQVAHSWAVYGGPGSTAHLREKLAEEGRKYIVATLKHFGQLRHSFIISRNPNATPYSVLTPAAARQRFDWHMGMLQGSLTVQIIMDYYCDSVGNRDDGDGDSDWGREDGDGDSDWEREARQSKRGTKRGGAGQNKCARKSHLGDASGSHARFFSKQGTKRWRQRRAKARRSTHQS